MIAVHTSLVSERIRVCISVSDPISKAGIATQLRSHPDIEIVDTTDLKPSDVALVVVDKLDQHTERTIRSLKLHGQERILLIASRLDDAGLMAALDAGARGVLRRTEATAEAVAQAVRAAASGDGVMPPDLVGRLLDQVARLQRQVLNPRGLSLAVLNSREVKVLKLMADGLDTREVARKLFYSERTVKNIVHDVTARLNLRNRTQAVAYALRNGLI